MSTVPPGKVLFSAVPITGSAGGAAFGIPYEAAFWRQGMLSQGVSCRAVLSGRASPKDNLFEGLALPVFIFQAGHPHTAGALSWAWAIVLSAHLSISP